MKPAAALIVAAAGALVVAGARRSSAGYVEGEPESVVSVEAIADAAETAFNVATEQPAAVPLDQAQANASAFLAMLRRAEGTEGRGGYRACFGYSHVIADLSEHPAVSGEWAGVTLSDGMCANAGFGPGCRSTAAGAYQLIRPTWLRLRDSLGLPDFGEASQDAAALALVRQRGALEDVKAGRFAAAVRKCRQEWASLPGNSARQGQRSIDTLAAWYSGSGGAFA